MFGDAHDQTIKVMLIGDSNVGKSTIMRQFTKKDHPLCQGTTVGLDFG